eukprot:CAMPEP_0205879290 /NCGR_PEP_ID=MMETSP1083-20121108/15323_1 /ASSEMBLY_ACC=CAM_ASM_000430 /TAXON_ID=97485 /ORGANISM="Prymnesium parvum, Strain Texoma1" /LENGTH=128 /DNA_ID=CAMNT_0053242249 /DNA_START=644 /DNA_END=1030 /DNA_ORIENTATION=-
MPTSSSRCAEKTAWRSSWDSSLSIAARSTKEACAHNGAGKRGVCSESRLMQQQARKAQSSLISNVVCKTSGSLAVRIAQAAATNNSIKLRTCEYTTTDDLRSAEQANTNARRCQLNRAHADSAAREVV